MIRLSLLPTSHPLGFQPKWVRASTTSYRRFTLAMDRSLRFGSRPGDSNALFGLAFATAPPHGLTSPPSTDSQAHSSKGTPSPQKAPTAWRHMVSGTISLPSRGTFHHSLTVLSAIGHQVVFRLNEWSRQIHTGFHGPRATRETTHEGRSVSPTGVSPSTPGLPRPFGYTTTCSLHPPPVARGRLLPQPRTHNPYQVSHAYGLAIIRFRSPLLTEYLLLRVLRCFTSPRSPRHPMNSDDGDSP